MLQHIPVSLDLISKYDKNYVKEKFVIFEFFYTFVESFLEDLGG